MHWQCRGLPPGLESSLIGAGCLGSLELPGLQALLFPEHLNALGVLRLNESRNLWLCIGRANLNTIKGVDPDTVNIISIHLDTDFVHLAQESVELL